MLAFTKIMSGQAKKCQNRNLSLSVINNLLKWNYFTKTSLKINFNISWKSTWLLVELLNFFSGLCKACEESLQATDCWVSQNQLSPRFISSQVTRFLIYIKTFWFYRATDHYQNHIPYRTQCLFIYKMVLFIIMQCKYLRNSLLLWL